MNSGGKPESMKAPRRGVRSPPRLELSGSEPSHEPQQSRSLNSTEKATSRHRRTGSTASATSAKPGVFAEGCGKIFRPRHAMARYCSEECRRKARQWSQWKSRQRWRSSENGRKKRRQQSIRHRERLRMTGQVPSGGKAARVGHHKPQRAKIFWRHVRPSR